MSPLTIQNSSGQYISSIEDWFKYAPPKEKEKHWKNFRSAKELAKAWFRPRVPEELDALFNSHSLTRGLVIDTAIPEKQTKLDDFRGESRNNDLILLGDVGKDRIVVGLEGKADEPFGQVINEYLSKKEGTKSKVPERIDLLVRSIFGRPVDSTLGRLRYQLLHGLAGTLIEAKDRKASLALFVVHEFISRELSQEKVAQNRIDFETFVHSFTGFEKAEIADGVLVGPIKVPGGKFVPNHIQALIGKVRTHLQ